MSRPEVGVVEVASSGESVDDDMQELVDYCSRPKCREEYRRRVGPGRRQAYCSELCRRTAERELRQIRSRLLHFERVVEQLRIDVAAFGRSVTESDGDGYDGAAEFRRKAEDALTRVAGILEFAQQQDDLLLRELKNLYTAVLPVVRRMEQ